MIAEAISAGCVSYLQLHVDRGGSTRESQEWCDPGSTNLVIHLSSTFGFEPLGADIETIWLHKPDHDEVDSALSVVLFSYSQDLMGRRPLSGALCLLKSLDAHVKRISTYHLSILPEEVIRLLMHWGIRVNKLIATASRRRLFRPVHRMLCARLDAARRVKPVQWFRGVPWFYVSDDE